MSPKVVDKKQKKLEILYNSYNFFIKNGIKNSSVDALIKHLNMGKGTFYHYFNSKDELIKELMQGITNEYIKYYDKKLPKCKTLQKKLYTLFELYLVNSKQNSNYIKLYAEYLSLYANAEEITKESMTYQNYLTLTIKEILKKQVEEGKIKKESLAFCNSFAATADGMIIYSFLLEDFNLQKEFKTYLDNLLEQIKTN